MPPMTVADHSLDLDRLEKVRHLPGKITARCPACGEVDRDRTGNHLAIFPTGKFSCVAYPDDPEHRRRIFALVGTKTDSARRDPEEFRRRRQDQVERRRSQQAEARITDTARRRRADIVSRFRWEAPDVWEDSPTRPDDAADDPRLFLASLFSPFSLLWTGEVHQSGDSHADRWRIVEDWFRSPAAEVGPMTTPATWRAGTVSRTREGIETAPFVVLDFDGPRAWKPQDESDLSRHLSESLALVRWLREFMHWRLAAVIYTGGKSIHAWFDDPGPACVGSLRNVLDPFGIDGSLIGHPEHPCRLPGRPHHKTGKTSRVLWLR